MAWWIESLSADPALSHSLKVDEGELLPSWRRALAKMFMIELSNRYVKIEKFQIYMEENHKSCSVMLKVYS